MNYGHILLFFLRAWSLMSKVKAGYAVGTTANIALDVILLAGHIFVEGKNVFAGFGILVCLLLVC